MSAEQHARYADATGTEPVRVVFFLRVRPGAAEDFRNAYEAIRWEAARVPGHIRDQLCQSVDEPDEWLLTSEWTSEEAFLAWERTPGHRDTAAPMIGHTVERRSLRYAVRATTESPGR